MSVRPWPSSGDLTNRRLFIKSGIGLLHRKLPKSSSNVKIGAVASHILLSVNKFLPAISIFPDRFWWHLIQMVLTWCSWTCECRENRCRKPIPIFLTGVNKIQPKFSPDLDKIRSISCQQWQRLRENRHNESHAWLRGLNKFLPVLYTFIVRYGRNSV